MSVDCQLYCCFSAIKAVTANEDLTMSYHIERLFFRASKLRREILQLLAKFPDDDDLHELLADVSSIYEELARRVTTLHLRLLHARSSLGVYNSER